MPPSSPCGVGRSRGESMGGCTCTAVPRAGIGTWGIEDDGSRVRRGEQRPGVPRLRPPWARSPISTAGESGACRLPPMRFTEASRLVLASRPQRQAPPAAEGHAGREGPRRNMGDERQPVRGLHAHRRGTDVARPRPRVPARRPVCDEWTSRAVGADVRALPSERDRADARSRTPSGHDQTFHSVVASSC